MSRLDRLLDIEDPDKATLFGLLLAILEALDEKRTVDGKAVLTRASLIAMFFSEDKAALEASSRLTKLEDLFDGEIMYRPGKKLMPLKAKRNK